MSEKLDQSLDEILSTRRQSARRGGRGGRRVANAAKPAAVAPVGGIKKSVKAARGNIRAVVPSGPSAGTGESKIIVSNLVNNHFLQICYTLANTISSLPTSTRSKSRYVELEATVFLDFPRQLLCDCRFNEPLRSSKE